jgi:hypothetical protein
MLLTIFYCDGIFGCYRVPVAEAIAEAEAMQTATSLVFRTTATMPAAELKKFDARNPPWQAKTTASPPSLLDFAIYFSQKSSNL